MPNSFGARKAIACPSLIKIIINKLPYEFRGETYGLIDTDEYFGSLNNSVRGMSRPWTLIINNPATMMMHIIVVSEFNCIITQIEICSLMRQVHIEFQL
jgi:hypothetical protein